MLFVFVCQENKFFFPYRQNCFVQISTHDISHHYINTNGPLHVGGISFGYKRFEELASALKLDR